MHLESEIRNRYPRLNKRAIGWLRHLHRKATTADDWSEDGEPHEWWDRYSTEPTLSFARFDLSESSYALGLMADQTPAWREVYADILEGLAERHLTYWAAIDWLTQFGPDPRRKSYPEEWVALFIPEHLVGNYDTPGWVANGVEPWGLQPDPIGADGNLFFKGWLNLIQSLHAYVTGEDKWGAPFHVAGVDRARFEWTQHRLVEHLTQQWRKNPIGPHCENTKVWPYCLSAAGLGLQLYDAVFDKQAHHVYGDWLGHTKEKYFGIAKDGSLEWCALYYDPLADHLQVTGPNFGLALAFYMMPQDPIFAEFLYRAAVNFLQWDNPASPIIELPDPRFAALGLAVAKEFGDYVTEARLRDYAERNFEPRHFGEADTEFGFWFQFGENWPRGQLSSLAMIAEVGEAGAWQKMFRQPNLEKFGAPTIEAIDYPRLEVAQAFNDKDSGMLQLTIFAGDPARSGQETSFRVAQLPNPEEVKIFCDGAEYKNWRIDGQSSSEKSIKITTTINTHSFQIFTGYRGAQNKKAWAQPDGTVQRETPPVAARQSVMTRRAVLNRPAVCGCCIPGAA